MSLSNYICRKGPLYEISRLAGIQRARRDAEIIEKLEQERLEHERVALERSLKAAAHRRREKMTALMVSARKDMIGARRCQKRAPVLVATIKASVAQYFRTTVEEMESSRRSIEIIPARHTAMYLAKTLTGCSYPELGRRFKRDHTTVLTAVRKMQARIDEGDKQTIENIAAIRFALGILEKNQ